jgi:cobalt/nickel transport system permease protein
VKLDRIFSVMIYEPFSFGRSWVHSLDPRFRVVFATVYSFTVALLNQFPSLLFALAFSLVLALMARLNARDVSKRLFVVFLFLLLIWVVLPFTFEGEAVYSFGTLAITKPGLVFSAQITLKSLSILLAFIATIATMTTVTLGRALNRMHIPGKLVHLLLINYRYIFVIEQEYQRLWTAIKIRGFQPKTSLHSYKTYAYLIGMLFVRASIRAERVSQAMRCRGFKGRFYSLGSFPPSNRNWVFSALMASVISLLIILEIR